MEKNENVASLIIECFAQSLSFIRCRVLSFKDVSRLPGRDNTKDRQECWYSEYAKKDEK